MLGLGNRVVTSANCNWDALKRTSCSIHDSWSELSSNQFEVWPQFHNSKHNHNNNNNNNNKKKEEEEEATQDLRLTNSNEVNHIASGILMKVTLCKDDQGDRKEDQMARELNIHHLHVQHHHFDWKRVLARPSPAKDVLVALSPLKWRDLRRKWRARRSTLLCSNRELWRAKEWEGVVM